MTDRLIVSVALSGLVHARDQNPHLPITPEEVAADARRCVDEGATILHLHARDHMGNPSPAYGDWAALLNAVRDEVPAALLCCSTSGRRWSSFEDRARPLSLTGWSLASLSVGSYNVGRDASVTDPAMVRQLHKAILDRGLLPEIEIFEAGHLRAAQGMKGWRNIFLGACLPAEPKWLALLSEGLDLWAGAGFGREQGQVTAWAIALGGHVRVGLEDNLWLDKGVPATNAALVKRAVALGRALGREPASPVEARLELFGG